MPIPVVDIFAGPGGLGEGFSQLRDVRGEPEFRIELSIEKDSTAHETLALRAFYRQFRDGPPGDYFAYLRGEFDREELYRRFPAQYRAASREAVCLELGSQSVTTVRGMVDAAIGSSDSWVLIGGPPCQAYSLIGRARNRGIEDYSPENDARQTLYLEYLQILADHAPAAFVMENVKGLLSASLGGERLFERIQQDLADPARAVSADRPRPLRRPRYRLFSLSHAPADFFETRPSEFVVRAERFGIPQRRHRVILLGVRDDIPVAGPLVMKETASKSTWAAIKDLPRVRSGLSDREDSAVEWRHVLRDSLSLIRRDADRGVAAYAEVAVESLEELSRGGEFLPDGGGDSRIGGWCNHATRGHIAEDLSRYLFVSCFALQHERSPELADFPESFLPKHKNLSRAIAGTHFGDRFRVQLWDRPSSTVTSHIGKDGHYYIHPDPTQCRSLTVREAARLQTFPDDYFFCGARTSQYQQVGNAVPPSLARQIAMVVVELLR